MTIVNSPMTFVNEISALQRNRVLVLMTRPELTNVRHTKPLKITPRSWIEFGNRTELPVEWSLN